ncbi:HPr family phosphocarrier protein [Paenibacillus lautus]|jgi:phosphocarrier protein HPr/phosphocarrier protein|uniref:Phosphocarrier protein HPr n=1 Tax=Paenibacillus lautus TaxID=1401 RepID=A0A2A5LDP3_PAELA|nr:MULTISPECIES: HPr family phosphocarrier protein [Paenibacillus]MBY0160718.1 HPr family phosphocarrier protein [Cytobacillus firmus]VTR22601.1 phosphotransferase system, phosphocarrier protein HPr [Actinobacillus pleuropneumoniae]AYB42851.1 HPr family phosphocarrier protein [Paenibacillus lautus]ETT68546.1 phosphotransferase system, phosphocarrier protein HPr [Paenibacillus sp. FSL H8-457]MCI1773642.1 HPr family phosphocarrier protein [Paenibacillus lautus]
MFAQTVTIQNEQGFHVRPAQLFSEKAGQFGAEVRLKTNEGRSADGKSMLELMTLGVEQGAVVTIEANGDGEQEVVEALIQLVESKFGEA